MDGSLHWWTRPSVPTESPPEVTLTLGVVDLETKSVGTLRSCGDTWTVVGVSWQTVGTSPVRTDRGTPRTPRPLEGTGNPPLVTPGTPLSLLRGVRGQEGPVHSGGCFRPADQEIPSVMTDGRQGRTAIVWEGDPGTGGHLSRKQHLGGCRRPPPPVHGS